MTEEVAGIAAGIIVALIAVIYGFNQARHKKHEKASARHSEEIIDIRERVIKLEVKSEAEAKQIGDHESGMIGQLHRYSKAIRRIFTRLDMRDE